MRSARIGTIRSASAAIGILAAIAMFAVHVSRRDRAAGLIDLDRAPRIDASRPGSPEPGIAHGTISGFVFDAFDRRPIVGARIVSGAEPAQATTTDDAGRFRLPAPHSPNAALWSARLATRSTLVRATLSAEADGYSPTTLYPLDLERGLTVDFVLRRAHPERSQGNTPAVESSAREDRRRVTVPDAGGGASAKHPASVLCVRIVDENGLAISNVTIETDDHRRFQWTDENGLARISGLDGSSHRFTATTHRPDLEVDPFEVAPGDTDVVRVAHRVIRIEGVIVDSRGEPIPWTQVAGRGTIHSSTWFSGDDGSFELRARTGERVDVSLTGRRLEFLPSRRIVEVESPFRGSLVGIVAPATELKLVASDSDRDR